MTEGDFKPRILGLLCHWCCYAAADGAGVSRYQYPPNIRAIRVMCTGRIDMRFILEAFKMGADGVFTGGCHLGDCHYQTGNYEAMVMAEATRQVLKMCGVTPERFELQWASAAEGPKFVQFITDFTMKVKELGPFGEGEGEPGRDEALRRLDMAIRVARNRKVRSAFGVLAKNLHKSGDYDKDAILQGVTQKVVPAFEKQFDELEMVRIIGFCCENAAQLSIEVLKGAAPKGVEIRPLPCTKDLEVHMVLDAFTEGGEAVFVVGCKVDTCQNKIGSLMASKKVKYAKDLIEELGLQELGLSSDRVEMFFAEQNTTEDIVGFIDKIKQMKQRIPKEQAR